MLDMPRLELGRLATHSDIVALPDQLVGEIIDDHLWTSPRPSPRHALAAGQLMATLGNGVRGGGGGRGGWWILPEPEVHIGHHVVVPDLAGWRRERLPRLPDTAYVDLAPDWLCEVLSPSTERLDREKKLPVYLQAGVGHVWLLDPLARTLDVLGRTGRSWSRLASHAGGDIVCVEPFREVDLSLTRLWDTSPHDDH